MASTPLLFTPLKLRSITLKNRLGVSPMCQYVAVDGVPQDWHVSHLTARATGGAGLVIAEATGVSAIGRITPGCTGIWNDEQTAKWKEITRQIKKLGSVPGIQIGHAGRKSSTQVPWVDLGRSLTPEEGAWETLAPSAVAFGANITHTPKAATEEDIEQLKKDFVNSAKRALEAGFEVLEIHGAHGYLLDQFLSPLSNHRTDKYGGSFENRNRLLCEITEDVRKVWPDHLPLFVRLSCSDWAEKGKTIEDSVKTAQLLKERGVDLVDCSSGFVSPDTFKNIKFGPGFQVPFSNQIRKEADVKTAAVGAIRSGTQAEAILQNQQADLILVATQFLADPFLTYHAALELGIPAPEAAALLPIQTGFYLKKQRLEALKDL